MFAKIWLQRKASQIYSEPSMTRSRRICFGPSCLRAFLWLSCRLQQEIMQQRSCSANFLYCLMHFLRKVMFSKCAFGPAASAHSKPRKNNQSSRCFFSGRRAATYLSYRHVLSSGDFLSGNLPFGALCLGGKRFMTRRLSTKKHVKK